MYKYESERREMEADEIAINQAEKEMLKKALTRAQGDAAKGKAKSAGARDEAKALAAELSQFEDKHPFRLTVDDTTPEKLVDIMSEQGGRITLSSAEGGVFDAMQGRYEKTLNIDIFLKAHACENVTIDRIMRGTTRVDKPCLTMILTVQPEVLRGLMSNGTMRGRGLCGRFLYAVCKSRVGERDVTPGPIPEHIEDGYYMFVRRILSDSGNGVITLCRDAYETLMGYAAVVETRLVNEYDHMRDWGGKLVGATVRIAALLHASECTRAPQDAPVSEATVKRADTDCRMPERPCYGRVSGHGCGRRGSRREVFTQTHRILRTG